MDLSRIIQAENCLDRLEARLGSLLERELHAELLDAKSILTEVRHFAVCWSDADEQDVQGDESSAGTIRHTAITRLVQTLRPD